MRVVRAVRAGEAKLRGRMQTVILIVGPPGCEYPGCARCPGALSLSFCAQAHGFSHILLFSVLFCLFLVNRCMGFKVCHCKNVVFYIGFKVCHCKKASQTLVFYSGS